ncbi:MAG: endonuclease/exonuclease/phosphatase family protein [Lewinellaceae bacterium]|nr:endonuclease/exonuclease/phosphatase family protein [Lewinellaceae bacterium]
MKKLFFLLFCIPMALSAQQKYQVGCIGFYNFENLFDTLNDPTINDEEFLPEGANRYSPEIYQEKLEHLAKVVSELGTELTPDGVSILGVAEVENRKVLEDFSQQPLVKSRNYQIVHFDSPDRRGIDVALLYQPKYFTVTASRAVPLMIYGDDSTRIYTRDILFVSGLYNGEPLHVLVNHWPSRRGGESATQPLRNAGAMVCKQIVDSLVALDANAKVLIMGDLNDDPVSPSVRQVLNAKRKKDQVRPGGLFNPMYDYYKKGIGTLAYRDAWSLFDQIILSEGFINPAAGGFQYFQTNIHNEPYLIQKTGHFKGYPFRTYAGSQYLGGYSDHFPVYIVLVKAI